MKKFLSIATAVLSVAACTSVHGGEFDGKRRAGYIKSAVKGLGVGF